MVQWLEKCLPGEGRWERGSLHAETSAATSDVYRQNQVLYTRLMKRDKIIAFSEVWTLFLHAIHAQPKPNSPISQISGNWPLFLPNDTYIKIGGHKEMTSSFKCYLAGSV